MNIYISNLRSAVNNAELIEIFSVYGEVKEAEVVMDVFTGQSRGFGYVVMDDDASAKKAIEALNKTELHELVIGVEEAAPKIVQKGSYKVGNSTVQGYKFRKN